MEQEVRLELLQPGPEFQAFANALLWELDPRTRVFTWPGPDGGQDARSGDGRTVYDAHALWRPTPTDARKAIRKKVKKAVERKKAKDKRWVDVEKLVLVTNFGEGSNQESWERKAFQTATAAGLAVDVWYADQVLARLEDCPRTKRQFFGREDRAFLTFPEVENHLSDKERGLMGLADEEEFVDGGSFAVPDPLGREPQLAQLAEWFAESKTAVLVKGPGGVGKSRLALECARQLLANHTVEQAYWANVATLKASPSSIPDVVAGRRVVLVAEDPPAGLLQRLLEQLATADPGASWRLIVTARPSDGPSLQTFGSPEYATVARHKLELEPLGEKDAEKLAIKLLAARNRANHWENKSTPARFMASRYRGYPIWLAAGVGWLCRAGEKNVPEDPQGLALNYVRRLCDGLGEPLTGDGWLQLLRWIASFGRVNRTEQQQLDFLTAELGLRDRASAEDALERLAKAGGVRAFGRARRYVAVEPDPIRDALLRDWLVRPADSKEGANEPTRSALDLVERLLPPTSPDAAEAQPEIPQPHRLLESLGRVGWQSDLRRELLGPLIRRLTSRVREETDARSVRALLARARPLAEVLPGEFAELVAAVRKGPARSSDEGYVSVTREEIMRSLPGLLALAARSALMPAERFGVAEELLALVEREAREWNAEDVTRRGSGNRARDVWTDVVHGKRTLLSDFLDQARRAAHRMLDEVERPESCGDWEIETIEAVLRPMLAVERREDYFDGRQFHMTTYHIVEGDPEAALRGEIRQRLWGVLSAGTAASKRLSLAWDLLRHQGMYQLPGEAAENLERAAGLLEGERGRNASLEELCAARRMWEWHLERGEDTSLRDLAKRCDAVFRSREETELFSGLLSVHGHEEHANEVFRRTAEALAGQSVSDIGGKFAALVAILEARKEKPTESWKLTHLARNVGFAHGHRSGVRGYTMECLGKPLESPVRAIGEHLADGRLGALREAHDNKKLRLALGEFIESCRDDAAVSRLLVRCLRPTTTVEDRQAVERYADVLLANAPVEGFRLLAEVGIVEWPLFERLMSRAWDAIPRAERAAACARLFDRFYMGARFEAEGVPSPWSSRLQWALDQTLNIPDLDELGGQFKWHLEDLGKRGLRLPISWYRQILEGRVRRYGHATDVAAEDSGVRRGRVLGWDVSLVAVVKPLVSPDDSASNDFDQIFALLGANADLPWRRDLYSSLARLDPRGVRFPLLVVDMIKGLDLSAARADLTRWSSAAAAYPFDSEPWRTIANATCSLAEQTLLSDDLYRAYDSLLPRMREGWSAPMGEIDPKWPPRIERAHEALESEPPGSPLRGFREWNLRRLRRDFEDWVADMHEERG